MLPWFNGRQGKLIYSTYLPLSWSDTCLEPLYIWAHCGMHAPRPESDTGSYSWHLVPSVSESKTTDEKWKLFCHKAMTWPENKKTGFHVFITWPKTMINIIEVRLNYHGCLKEEDWSFKSTCLSYNISCNHKRRMKQIAVLRKFQKSWFLGLCIKSNTTLSKSFSSSIVCLLATSSWTVWPQFFTTDSRT